MHMELIILKMLVSIWNFLKINNCLQKRCDISSIFSCAPVRHVYSKEAHLLELALRKLQWVDKLTALYPTYDK